MKKEKQSAEKKIAVNGRFFAPGRITGIQRVAIELLKVFATMKDLDVTVILPPDAPDLTSDAGNIRYVKTGKFTGTKWEQWSLPRYCRKLRLPLLSTGNLAPILYNRNDLILHDVIFKEKDGLGTPKKFVKNRRLATRAFIYRCKSVITVSEFSADRIMHFYPRLKERPCVARLGHEHVLKWGEEAVDVSGEFYFSAGTTFRYKNFRYILELAKANPEKQFLVAGDPLKDFVAFIEQNGLKNFKFLGYVTNGQMAWLYRHCSGFIQPSLYEGFGMPPLEAIACGCRKLYLADIPVFREIYGGLARFFDGTDHENTVALDGKDTMTEEQAQKLLGECTWENMAQTVVSAMLRRGRKAC